MKLDSHRTTRIYEKLLRVAPDIRETKGYAKSKVSGLMDLNLDVLERSQGYMRIALSHYWLHPSGDMIPDPDMEIAVFLDDGLAEALSFQDAFGYEVAYLNGETLPILEVHARLNEFLEYWLNNLVKQGHVLPKGR
jgi:uncharacterized protein YqiB (DUF1249 family)